MSSNNITMNGLFWSIFQAVGTSSRIERTPLRKNRAVRVIAVTALQLLMGPPMSHANCDLLKIAEQYIAKRFLWFDATGKKLMISEKGHLWQLTYQLPIDMLGGAPIITIDKRTCEVVRAVHEQ